MSLKIAKNVIGRTNWDKEIVTNINPNIRYFHNNESLRKNFYEGKWNYDDCNRYTIFISQGGYPLKGLHFAINALNILKQKYPNVKLIVSGNNNILKRKILWNSYSRYINRLIQKFGLAKNILFCGPLSKDDIKKEYLKANCYILTSTLENSSNSLGEALLLGLPVVASNAGGTSTFISDNYNGLLYECYDYVKLSEFISRLFDSKAECVRLSNNAVKSANKFYNYNRNSEELMDIYNVLLKK